jgi:cystathionine gamma-synthase
LGARNGGASLKQIYPDFLGQTLPLGFALGPDEHAVSSHFPSLADVHGYERKEDRVLSALQTGYPRFWEHPWVSRLRREYAGLYSLTADDLVLFQSPPDRKLFEAYWTQLFPSCEVPLWFDAPKGGFFRIPQSVEGGRQAVWKFAQHFGGGLSSRAAESFFKDSPGKPVSADPYQDQLAEGTLRKQIPELKGKGIHLFSSGMSAISQTLLAIDRCRQPGQKKRWAKVGWLYTDTLWLLDFLSDGKALSWLRVPSIEDLIRDLEKNLSDLTGIFVEYPTNPLLETADLQSLSAWCRRWEIPLVVDPTLQGIWNFSGWQHADVVVTSLTKYAGWSGNLLGGMSIVPDNSPWRVALEQQYTDCPQVLAGKEASLLVQNLPGVPEYTRKSLALARLLTQRLSEHSAVESVFYPKDPTAQGAVFSFSLKNNMADTFDRLKMAKGPSFGTSFSNICPYLHLAHFDLVTSEKERIALQSQGIPPDLLRFSAGTENPESVWEILSQALPPL